MINIDKHAVQAVADLKAGYTLGHADVELIQQMALDAVTLLDELEAAEKRIAELERKEQHSDRQSVIDALASSGEEWSDIEEYMQKWDAERASAAGKGE